MAYEIEALLEWLLDTDPALRWQVERDLLDAPRGLAGDPGPGRHRGFRRPAAGAAGRGRPVGRRRVLPADFDFDGPEAARAGSRGRRRHGRSTALRDWGLDAVRARRHGGEAGGQQPLGVRRPAVLGRRGGLLHQRLHAGQRRLAGRRRVGLGRLVRRAPAARRRLELRVGERLDPVVIPLHAEHPARACSTRSGTPAATTRCAPRDTAGEEYLLRTPPVRRLSTGELVGPWATRVRVSVPLASTPC